MIPRPPEKGTLYQVTGPLFAAGLVIYRGQVIDCAPILRRWCTGPAADVLDTLRRQGWRVAPIATASEPRATQPSPPNADAKP